MTPEELIAMPIVFIPTMFLELTGGENQVEIAGNDIKSIINELEVRFPGIEDRLVNNRRLKPDLAVAIDGETCRLGLMEPVPGSAQEIHFIASIAGG